MKGRPRQWEYSELLLKKPQPILTSVVGISVQLASQLTVGVLVGVVEGVGGKHEKNYNIGRVI